jgi:hypothetical protein
MGLAFNPSESLPSQLLCAKHSFPQPLHAPLRTHPTMGDALLVFYIYLPLTT